MGERLINQKFNVHNKDNEMNIVNPYRYATGNSFPAPFAYYRFEGDATDETGTHNASIVDSVTFPTTDLPPFGTNSVYFDRTLYSRIGIPDSDDFTPLNNGVGFTWSFWTNTSVTSGTNMILAKRSSTPDRYEYQFWTGDSNKIVYNLYNLNTSTNLQVSQSGLIPTGWNHIAYTFNGFLDSNFEFITYKNGTALHTVTSAGSFTEFSNTSSVVWLGNDRGRTSGFNTHFTGNLAGLAFFNVKLTADEVLAVYDEQNSGNHLL